MERIRIVTDSTADLSAEQVQQYDLTVVPLGVSFGSESFQDGVDLDRAEFYRKLVTTPEAVRTSQPSPSAFAEVYRKLSCDTDTIISIHISSKLSGTVNAANAASLMVGANVVVVDTKTASQGIGRSVLIAAEAVRRGLSLDHVLSILNQSINSTFSAFAVDTLEYLRRNGRIGRAGALIGSMLQIKPILHADRDGLVAIYDKVRGRSQVIPRLMAAAKENLPPGSAANVSVVHSGPADQAQLLLAQLAETYQIVDQHIGMVGPAIGAHVGPGCLGLMIQPAFDALLEQAEARSASVAS